MTTVSILGVGRAGGAIAIALDRAGYRMDRLITRGERDLSPILAELTYEPSVTDISELSGVDSDVLIIATGDSEIGDAVERLSRLETLPSTILHLSGSLSSEILFPLKRDDVSIGSLHPLVALSDAASGADRLTGAYFCVEGEVSAVAEEVVSRLGGRSVTIPTERKALYHAAAVTTSGHYVALVDVAIEMLRDCGLDDETAREILLPLIGSTYANLQHKPTNKALTGPYARGDADAFERHFAAMADSASDVRKIYLALAARSIALMIRADPDNDSFKEVADAIDIAKEKLEC